jgi:hypothetical protein
MTAIAHLTYDGAPLRLRRPACAFLFSLGRIPFSQPPPLLVYTGRFTGTYAPQQGGARQARGTLPCGAGRMVYSVGGGNAPRGARNNTQTSTAVQG